MNRFLSLLLLLFLYVPASAQRDLTLPEASQEARVFQRIGVTDMTISYHSPLVNDRKVWGVIVPYDALWRAGANENTTIEFSTSVKVNGQALPAGTYGIHMIPAREQWTIIFSKDYRSWGSFFYDEKQDALRIKATPKEASLQNWLSYSFINPGEHSVGVQMHWEKLVVEFTVDIDVPETVIQSMREELKSIPGFFPDAYQQAAAYCVRNKVHLDQAQSWINKSISLQKNFANLNTKAQLIELQGRKIEADSLKKAAMMLADEPQLNAYGYELLGQGNREEAILIFKENVKKYPDSWNVYDSLAEAYEKSGQNENAITNYNKALKLAPENQKERIQSTIKRLKQ